MKFLSCLFLFLASCSANQNISVKVMTDIKNVGTISGTAFKIDNHIVTAGHVCEAMLAGNANARFEYLDGDKWVAVGGEYAVLRISPTSDICELSVVQPSNNRLRHLELATDWHSGEPISVYGAPLGIGPSRVDGYLTRRIGKLFLAQVMCLPGNSGSPVLNEDGEVLGMLVAGYENISVLAPYQEIKEFLEN